MLIKGESREEWNQLVADMTNRFQPADNVELGLIHDIASATWRARRAERMEAEIINAECDNLEQFEGPAKTPAEQVRRAALAYAQALGFSKAIAELGRQSERLHRLGIRLHAKLKELQKDRAAADPAAPTRSGSSEKPSPGGEKQKSKNEPESSQPKPGQPFDRGFYIRELLSRLEEEATE